MPVGWPLHIDGAVRQCCIHRSATLQELDDMLGEYDMKRDSEEINHKAPQWSHNAVWNRKYMEPKHGYTLRQLWADSEPAIGRKSSPSYEVKESDIRRAVAAIADLPSSTLPDSPFILALGTPAAQNVPPQAPWHREPWRNGSAPCVKTRQLRSLSKCKPADRPSSKKMAAKCLLPLSLTGHSRTLRH